jgi:hypothetical protein
MLDLEKIEKTPMSDSDIRAYLPRAKIVVYSDLKKLSNIQELLPNEKDYAFLLYEWKPLSGHWTALLRDGDTVEVFDAYGVGIDRELKWLPYHMRKMLGEDVPLLKGLIKRSGFKPIWNKMPFQSSNPSIETCGRWSVWRVLKFLQENEDLKEFRADVNQLKQKNRSNI